ncbi:MAG: hypothetical protein E2O39_04870 [Planctomycetota bacterium]|nr:MAG: hypothetical protein E2O39_04870 [Planctomycetota bacterium]
MLVRMRRAAFALALALAPGCGGSTTSAVTDTPIELERPTVIPLREGVLPIIEVTLDGRSAQPFLVDSGASLTVIDLPQAEALGLFIGPYSHGSTTNGSGGGAVAYDSYAAAGLLEAGDVRLTGARIPAIDMEMLRDLGPVGILGQDLLARLVVVFDMPRRELHMLPAGTDSDGIAAYLRDAEIGDGTWAQMPIDFRPCPFVSLDIEGSAEVAAEMELDTGAESASLPAVAIEALGLEATGTATARGLDGTYEEATYHLEKFGLYGFPVTGQFKRSPLDYGLLGMDVLGEFVFILDGPGETVWLHHRKVELFPSESND